MKNFLSIFAVVVAMLFTTATFAQCSKSQAGAACCKDKNKAQAATNPVQIVPASTTAATGDNTTKAGACGKQTGACCKDKAGAKSAAACQGHATAATATEGKTCQGHADAATCSKDKKSAAKAKGKKMRAEKLVLNNTTTKPTTATQATPQR
ncbi:MAG: hypothetical protein JNM36_10085 [Chitinophagales bacterium]|jgi:hypothetical protein|nr:hypothetical protein [Chitinophagales bacterium]